MKKIEAIIKPFKLDEGEGGPPVKIEIVHRGRVRGARSRPSATRRRPAASATARSSSPTSNKSIRIRTGESDRLDAI